MLQLHKALASAKTPGERNALQGQIEASDRQIGPFVHESHGLIGD